MSRSASIPWAARMLALPLGLLAVSAAVPAQTSIPQGAVIKKALFTIETYRFVYEQPVTLHQILEDWDERSVTWNSFFAAVEPYRAASAGLLEGPGGMAGACAAEVTALVQRWVDRPAANFGLLLAQEGGQSNPSNYHSREGAIRPRLEVVYAYRCRLHRVVFDAIADAHISERPGFRDLNYGEDTSLYTGAFVPGGETSAFSKLSMVRFEVAKPVKKYCASSAGYWKTHSSRGPARPADPVWTKALEKQEFFGTGETWLSTLWRVPRGDAYWILANQYVAARLNELRNGWVPALIERALLQAEVLLEKYGKSTSSPRIGPRSCDRALALGLALILDIFNNSGCTCIR